MQSPEQKLEKALLKDPNTKGVFSKKKPTTVAEATASLRENIENLKHVHETRKASADRKAETIAKLEASRREDSQESGYAKRIADKLESFFFDVEEKVDMGEADEVIS